MAELKFVLVTDEHGNVTGIDGLENGALVFKENGIHLKWNDSLMPFSDQKWYTDEEKKLVIDSPNTKPEEKVDYSKNMPEGYRYSSTIDTNNTTDKIYVNAYTSDHSRRVLFVSDDGGQTFKEKDFNVTIIDKSANEQGELVDTEFKINIFNNIIHLDDKNYIITSMAGGTRCFAYIGNPTDGWKVIDDQGSLVALQSGMGPKISINIINNNFIYLYRNSGTMQLNNKKYIFIKPNFNSEKGFDVINDNLDSSMNIGNISSIGNNNIIVVLEKYVKYEMFMTYYDYYYSISDNNGVTWSTPTLIVDSSSSAYLYSSGNHVLILTQFGEKNLISSNDGKTLIEITPGIQAVSDVLFNDKYVVFGSRHDIYYSEDYGKTFKIIKSFDSNYSNTVYCDENKLILKYGDETFAVDYATSIA